MFTPPHAAVIITLLLPPYDVDVYCCSLPPDICLLPAYERFDVTMIGYVLRGLLFAITRYAVADDMLPACYAMLMPLMLIFSPCCHMPIYYAR